MQKVNIGIFGATGEVGQEIVNVLDELAFPVGDLSLYGGRSAGTILKTPYGEIEVQNSRNANYHELGLAFWAVGKDWSLKEWGKLDGSDCYVIDNSSTFRHVEGVPLIIPEINGNLLEGSESRLIANPNCTTAIAAMPLKVLDDLAGIKNISFTTYQSASGAGNKGIAELLEQTRNELNSFPVENKVFPHPIPFNLIPYIPNEEEKLERESRKILRLEDSVGISATCTRVPIKRSHSIDVVAETSEEVDLNEFASLLDKQPYLEVVNDVLKGDYPMPINTSGRYSVQVGRIRHPKIFERGVRMYVCGDQLLRGAALNAVLIAHELYDSERLS